MIVIRALSCVTNTKLTLRRKGVPKTTFGEETGPESWRFEKELPEPSLTMTNGNRDAFNVLFGHLLANLQSVPTAVNTVFSLNNSQKEIDF